MDNNKGKKLKEKALQGAAVEAVERFGSAVKEHIVSYFGLDNELKKKTKRSLKSISESKVDDAYKKQNIKQQAGFSAEVKASARENAEKIIDGSYKRTKRTDDINPQIDSRGRPIGGTNDPLFDLAEVYPDGTVVEGTQRQLKFVGGSPNECVKKLLDKKYDKYRDNDVVIEIPKDFYKEVKQQLETKEKDIQKQIDNAKKNSNTKLCKKLEKQKEKVVKTRKNLKKSNVSNKEAIFARKHPEISTAKDVAKVANKAGLHQAGIGAVMSGSISIIKNFVACAKGEIEPKAAATAIVKDTGKGAANSYATAFSGAIIKGSMQNASSEYIRSISTTSFPAQIVSTTVNVGKVMTKFIKGEITGTECITQLGEDGFGELGAAMYATAFTAATKGLGSQALTVIAGVAGSTVGYMAAVAVYQELKTSLVEYNLAVKERKQIEAECAEAVSLIREYREQMIADYENELIKNSFAFQSGLDAMDKAIISSDINGFLASNAKIQEAFNRKPQFHTQEEFDNLMLSDTNFVL